MVQLEVGIFSVWKKNFVTLAVYSCSRSHCSGRFHVKYGKEEMLWQVGKTEKETEDDDGSY